MAEAELDDVDRILVRELIADGRATLAHLATAAGLSVSAVQSRVRRLESRGVIIGYTARINPEAVGHMLSAFVAITPLDPSQPDDAPARLQSFTEIESCHSVAGEESYVLVVRVASARALEGLLQRIRTVANVRTRSTIILQTFYDDQVSLPE
ncbi:Lrp/AsnC family transcriptional regulator [Mycolicibacterium llatzerense]|uniref:AsnC family transcriptional regulator n=1 Tax=Mycolicibacterium llatzerense TaxID=280871 RepID=A0A0D1LDX1_9MYCO|nr:Lrp/AsnC family transcriptional regulator [Mycolicibacterium llatzerense]KIU16577.1 AsnC family transcriptional regulator [Mycolicibacterium llatzerense]MCT7365252.1 AsnC family transcriptional regulator [Mycolicibacterium llatzerense]MCT7370373.1 AsnC family transcriptional regulator [Mycolicibacterium llatzerense]